MFVLEPVANDLWLIEGPIVRAYGFASERLVIAHGACSMANGTEVLRRAFRWLL